jgi:hypothetical protein
MAGAERSGSSEAGRQSPLGHANFSKQPTETLLPPLGELHGATVLDEKQCQEFADFIKETLTANPDGCFVALAPKIEYLMPLRNKLLAARIGFGEPNDKDHDVRVMLATPETMRLIMVPISGLVFHDIEPYVLR